MSKKLALKKVVKKKPKPPPSEPPPSEPDPENTEAVLPAYDRAIQRAAETTTLGMPLKLSGKKGKGHNND